MMTPEEKIKQLVAKAEEQIGIASTDISDDWQAELGAAGAYLALAETVGNLKLAGLTVTYD